MQTAKIFKNGRSQAVRLPKEFQFNEKEVIIQKIGDAVILFPKNKSWKVFLHGLSSFSSDYLAQGREKYHNETR